MKELPATECMCGEVMELMTPAVLEWLRPVLHWKGIAIGHVCVSCGLQLVVSAAASWVIEPAPESRLFKRRNTKRDRLEGFRLYAELKRTR